MDISAVTAVQDDSCHWYVIPKEMSKDFFNDLQNEDMCDSGAFDDKYGKYRTGGDLNNTQLFIKNN